MDYDGIKSEGRQSQSVPLKEEPTPIELKFSHEETLDTKPVAPLRKRVRYFMDAVVITMRKRPDEKPPGLLSKAEAGKFKKEQVSVKLQPKAEVSEIRLQNLNSRKFYEAEEAITIPPEEGGKPKVLIGEGSSVSMSKTSLKQKLEDDKNMDKWKNPKRVKKEAMLFSRDTIRERITAAGISFERFPIELKKSIVDTMVSRDFMSRTYGGSSQQTFPKIGENHLSHGYQDFMYLPPDYQPVAPEVPGSPGLWISVEEEGREFDRGIRRVFTRISTGPALWQYQGQYEIKRAKAFTPDEWASQTPLVRNTWSKELCRQGWGSKFRARIYAKNHWGNEPTQEECVDIIASNLYLSVTETDVALALDRGDQALAVYTMKCVGYDAVFQTALAERWAKWVPPPRKPGGSKKRKVEEDPPKAGSGSSSRAEAKRRRRASTSSDDDFSSESEKEDVVMVDSEFVYHPKGTRSRPHIVR